MSITPSQALLQAISSAKIRIPASTHAVPVARAKAGEANTAVPTPTIPDLATLQRTGRPLRRGSFLDISV